jgi:hypothetical protein
MSRSFYDGEQMFVFAGLSIAWCVAGICDRHHDRDARLPDGVMFPEAGITMVIRGCRVDPTQARAQQLHNAAWV